MAGCGRVQRTDVETSFNDLPADLNKILSSSTILSPPFVLEILPLQIGSSGSVISSPGRLRLGRENYGFMIGFMNQETTDVWGWVILCAGGYHLALQGIEQPPWSLPT